MNAIELRDVAVRRGPAHVLHGVDLRVAEGRITALLGGNGAGKSTCLRTISGLHRPYRGTLTIAGADATRLTPDAIVRLGVAHVPEARQVFPAMTVQENLRLGAYTRPRITARAMDEVFDAFPVLAERRHSRAGVLSGGQQQMLAVGRALMSEPSILLMDEPTLGLAPALVQEIARLVTDINRRGITVLLVEQNAAVALEVCHTGYVLTQGRVVVSGTRDELRNTVSVRDAYLGTARPRRKDRP